MKRLLVIGNCFALALVAAVCAPLVMHGTPLTACSTVHVACAREQHVSVRFAKIAFSSAK